MIVSASDLTRTRLCGADLCPHEAETNSRLCSACQRKDDQKGVIAARREKARKAAYARDYRARINRELKAARAAETKRQRDRDHAQARRDANRALGLTGRGKLRTYKATRT